MRGGIQETFHQNCNHHPETSRSTQQFVPYQTLKNDDNLEDDDEGRLGIWADAWPSERKTSNLPRLINRVNNWKLKNDKWTDR